MATMQGALVTDWSQPPKFTTIPKPSVPEEATTVTLRVLATGIHQVVRSRASGQHYTSGPLPHIPGVDGTGVDPATGKVYYFSVLGSNGSPSKGTFSEEVVVSRKAVRELPDGVDPVLAAALTNPVMSSWMALKYRAQLQEGWSCVIIGVTSASGRIAVKVARQLGAVKVFGAARRESELKDMDLDGYSVLNSDEPSATDFSAVSSATVLLDYLWGPWPSAYLTSTAKADVKTPLQIVSIGSMAGEQTPLPSAVLRSRDVTIRGAGPGAWSPADMANEIMGMLGVLKGITDDGKMVKKMKLEEVEEAWKVKGPRVVLVNEH